MLPNAIQPMLAVAVPQPFDSDDHLFEIKWDGIRCLAFMEGGRVRLQSRDLIDITARFPELGCLTHLSHGTVLDGELVAMEGNKPSLGKVQRRVLLQDRHRIELTSQSFPVVYVVFDLIYLDGKPLVAKPLLDRRRHLEQLLSTFPRDRIILSEAVLGQGRDLFQAAQKLGLEGVMAKCLDGPYRPGKRSALWKKIKLKGYRRPTRRNPSIVWR
jgi:bifunctional non-homologous end joining protein LigD